MSSSSKISLMIFFQVLSPLFIIIGLIIKDLSSANPILPDGIIQNLNWFQQNTTFSSNWAIGLFIVGGIFTVIAILLSISVSLNSWGSDDENISKSLRKIR